MAIRRTPSKQSDATVAVCSRDATLAEATRTLSDCVFSHADPAQTNRAGQPHNGGIYRAANFVYAGQARATDCWRTPAGKVVSAAKAYRRFKTFPPVRVVTGLPGLCQVIDGVHRTAAVNPQAYFNCGHREQV